MEQQPEAFYALVVSALFFVFAALIVGMLLKHRRQSWILRAQIELQTKLLDRLTAGQELRAYLESGAARSLLDALRPQTDEALTRVLPAAMAGCVFLVMGAGLFVLPQWFDFGSPAVILIGAVVLSAGLGLLLAAALAFFLVKSWGLIGR